MHILIHNIINNEFTIFFLCFRPEAGALPGGSEIEVKGNLIKCRRGGTPCVQVAPRRERG
jgi:hypothetical protein